MSEANESTVLDGGTYEIIKNRLNTQAGELRTRLEKLNQARKSVFGAIETKLLGNERITTANNCTPRDMTPIGERFIFGYNVHLGLRSETNPNDVFAVYKFEDGHFHQEDLSLIGDPRFLEDFRNLYKYYKHTTFAKFALIGPYLFMVFRVGKSVQDIKTFKWLIDKDKGDISYVDNRGEREFTYPPQHEFEWVRTHRDLHRSGPHPHVSIEDLVFVETVGGDLTVKVEDNTETGAGIYAEPVDHADQTLDDAEIFYAKLDSLILLKIRPYQEKAFRYLVFNQKLETVTRIDSIHDACILLPDDHGLIFPNGYYLQSGEYKTFDENLQDMMFEKRLQSPNGEDYLFTFYNRENGSYVLLSYNLIEQTVRTPFICNGYSFFEQGELVYCRAEEEPQKHHLVQLWQTSYVGQNYVPPIQSESALYKIGNKDIVRAMAECHEVLNLIRKDETYANLYLDLLKKCTGVIDSYFWLAEADAFDLASILGRIREAAASAVEEFEKVVRIRKATQAEIQRVSEETEAILTRVRTARGIEVSEFVRNLADLRGVRGRIISARELRYADEEALDALEKKVIAGNERLTEATVTFLLKPEALEPYSLQVQERRQEVAEMKRVATAREVEKNIVACSGELELLIDIVGNLKIEDATQTTRIIDSISAIYTELNQVKSTLKVKKKELAGIEGVAAFNAQMKLIGQGLINYLDLCDEPTKCETYLTKLMVQVEELEGKFSDFDDFVAQLAEKREEIYSAFEARRLQLVESRNKKAASLFSAAERILNGIKNRVASMPELDAINGYFASDLMVEKYRDIIDQLNRLDDSVKAGDLQSRLKTAREEAVRQLKDRQELFVDGDNVIKFGRHRFAVNVQHLTLTIVARDDGQYYHLTGTDFFEKIRDPEFEATAPVWRLEVPSENKEVYRGEFLAFHLLQHLKTNEPGINATLAMDSGARLDLVRRFMGPRYAEGYSKGVHDHDALLLLDALLAVEADVGLLIFGPDARACASVFWHHFCPSDRKAVLQATFQGLAGVLELFPALDRFDHYIQELTQLLTVFCESSGLFAPQLADDAAAYLFRELVGRTPTAISLEAAKIYEGFHKHLHHKNFERQFREHLKGLEKQPVKSFTLLRDWFGAYCHQEMPEAISFRDEAAALAFCGNYEKTRVVEASLNRGIDGLKGDHPVIQKGHYRFHYNAFTDKLSHFTRTVSPLYERYVGLKKKLADQFSESLRLESFKPRVLSSFVRNRLIDEVYLPLIGDNLAKQAGTVGADQRTDRMGLLLLVSPPGYGKTTLMEYVANRLGIIFMKINGPAIGHQVTSIDPAEAPNAAARQEMEKLNLALEMGDNVMIYLDDIQHCNPELLQKFISLCDGQRKIEGVYKGRTRTYDLRGKKVAVVMAGNPYTESGEKFQIPDMLANRADTYNLGDIIGETADVFKLSYLENALTSNPVLNHLAGKSHKDVLTLIHIAETDSREGITFESNLSTEEVNASVNVLKKLLRVRDVILAVNLAYIQSAAQADAYRTEPAFKLQGSYRNMNKIAEKVLPIMNDEELEALVRDHYESEAQTLTSGAEANLLKFKELIGTIDDTEKARWDEIKRTFRRHQSMYGVSEGDQVGQVIAQLGMFGSHLERIQETLSGGLTNMSNARERETRLSPDTMDHLRMMMGELRSVVEAVEAKAQTGDDRSKETALMLEVLLNQFKVMASWLKPMQDASEARDQELTEIKKAMKASLGTHKLIIDHLRGGKKPAPMKAAPQARQPVPQKTTPPKA